MKLLILSIVILLSFPCFAGDDEPTKAETDLNIIEGDYELKKGALDFCSAGPVGWFNTKNSGNEKGSEMLMLGTRFVFAKINQPKNEQLIGDCNYSQKTETQRAENLGILTETETRFCNGLTETTRRTVRVEKDKIFLEVRVSNSEAKNSNTSCHYSLKRPSRNQQSVKTK